MEAVAHDEALLAAIVRSADDAIFSHSLDGLITSWNGAAERLFGYSADEVVGTPIARLAPPGQPNDAPELLGRLARGERIERYETTRYTRDARPIRVALTISPVIAADGAALGATTIAREVGVLLSYEEVIAGAEERFRGILEAAPNALVIVDESGRIEYANARFGELFGYEPGEVTGTDIRAILPGKSADRSSILVGAPDQPAVEVDRPDAIGRRRDGTELPIELGINTFRAGGRQLVAASIVDLSARRAVENEVIEIARQQAAIADLGRLALGRATLDELLEEAVEVVARVLGADLVEVLERIGDGSRLRLRAGRGWRPGLVGALEIDAEPGSFAGHALRSDEPAAGGADQPATLDASLAEHGITGGVRLRIPGGAVRFGLLGVHRRREQPFERRELNFLRGVVNILGTAIEHRRAEDDLRATTETLDALVTALPIAVTVRDLDGTIRLWNPAAEHLLGWPAAEVIGRNRSDLAADGDGEHEAIIARIVAGEVIRGVDEQRRRRDGAAVDVQIHGAPLRGGDRRIIGAVVLLVDVTATRRLEEQLLQAQKMESIGRLAGGVAHDFNNLLTGIFGYTSLLADELPADDRGLGELVQGIHESAEKAAALTAQLLAFSRRQVLQPRIVALNEVVAGIEPLLRRIIGETVALRTVLRPGIGQIRADPSQVEQVIVNLVVNARDAMPDGGTVAIETGEATFDEAYSQEHFDVAPGDYVMLAVTDGGVGMDAETRMHLFEPFFTTKGPGRGTGLGLATTYGIVKQSGGHIWLYSEPGHGTTFKLYFPRVGEPPDTTRRGSLPVPARGTGTVLFVEDEDAVRAVVTTVLRRHGYEVLAAADGAQAVDLVRAHAGPIDLLVTDVVMPGMSGRELADRIRDVAPAIRVLYISGYTEDAIVRQGVLDANVAFLPKPFSPETLARTVADVLAGRASDAVPTARV